jgi:hypothetical protein
MRRTISLLTAVLMLLAIQPARTEFKPADARINFMKGQVEIQRVNAEDWRPAFIKMGLYPGDRIKCQAAAEAEIVLHDGSVVKLKDASLLQIEQLERDRKAKAARTALKLYHGKVLGSIRKISSKESRFTITTPTAVAGIRGTVFGVFVEGDTTELNVLKGEVGLSGERGPEVLVGEKMMATVARGDSALNPVAMTAAKIAFMTMWAGAAIKIGSMGSAAATAWYATTPAIIGGAAAVVAATTAVIIISGGDDETPPPPPGAPSIPPPPGWPNP